jgi:phenylpropionate dioxygenase-like ring-hydroxylating dioxygenase large terminal subunit
MTSLLGNSEAELRRFWHPVGRVDQLGIDTPTHVTLLGEGHVVWRDPVTDAFVAFADRCPHRAAQLSAGHLVDGVLQCAYHGWRFAGDGRCVLIPALGAGAARPPAANLTRLATREAFGLVWIALDDPYCELLAIPEWDDPALRRAWLPSVDIRVSAGQFLDNFCDFAHFPFVHRSTFGAGEDAVVGDYVIVAIDDGYQLIYEHQANNTEDPLVATNDHPLLQPRRMEYTYRVPFGARLRIEYPMSKLVNVIVTWAQPLTADTTRVHTCMLRNDIVDDAALAAAIDYEMAVLAEDKSMLERMAVFGLALDVRDAVHTRADRSTIELRRCLDTARTAIRRTTS